MEETYTIHKLKTWPVFFEAIMNGTKTFEVRYNDRRFKVGDRLDLLEFDPDAMENGKYTGRHCHRFISYILDANPFIDLQGYAILGLQPLTARTEQEKSSIIIEGFKKTLKYEIKSVTEKLEQIDDPFCEGQLESLNYALEMLDKHIQFEQENLTDAEKEEINAGYRSLDPLFEGLEQEKPFESAEEYLNECIDKATPNLSKIKDVDKELDEIRGVDQSAEEILTKYLMFDRKEDLWVGEVLRAMEDYASQKHLPTDAEIEIEFPTDLKVLCDQYKIPHNFDADQGDLLDVHRGENMDKQFGAKWLRDNIK